MINFRIERLMRFFFFFSFFQLFLRCHQSIVFHFSLFLRLTSHTPCPGGCLLEHRTLTRSQPAVRLTAEHRLDTSSAERARIEAAGGEVRATTFEEDGKPVGPLRVWPGGGATCLLYSRFFSKVSRLKSCILSINSIITTVKMSAFTSFEP